MAVAHELEKLEISFTKVALGEVDIVGAPDATKLRNLKSRIEILGFDLIDDKKSRTIEKIKAEIIKAIHRPDQKIKINFSAYLSEKIGKDYSSLGSLFSEETITA